jgi:hypothetical protein
MGYTAMTRRDVMGEADAAHPAGKAPGLRQISGYISSTWTASSPRSIALLRSPTCSATTRFGGGCQWRWRQTQQF